MMHAYTTTPARPHAARRSMRHRIAAVALSIALATTGTAPAFAETTATDGGGPSAEHTSQDTTAPASASPDRAITTRTYKYTYVNVKRTFNWTNKRKQLGVCKIERGAGGGTCTISASYTVTSSVGVNFGLSEDTVAAGLRLDAARSISGTVSWTSPKAPVGASYKAWAVGTRVTFKIQKWKIARAGGRTVRTLLATSPTLYAFEPVRGFAVGQ